MADIDLSGYDGMQGRPAFNIIAPGTNAETTWDFEGTPFRGVFDGHGHTISHLTITGTGSLVGLFGLLGFGAEVKELGVVDVNTPGPSALHERRSGEVESRGSLFAAVLLAIDNRRPI